METFDQTLERYGADPAAVRSLNGGGPDLLPYATLVAARRLSDSTLAALTGVYEWQNSPLVFLVEAERLNRSEDLNHIRRTVAMRGDAQYLGVVSPGRLTVYLVSLDGDPIARAQVPLAPGKEQATFATLGNFRPGVAQHSRGWISKVVLSLLSSSISELTTQCDVSDHDAISLVGRALFSRFLADRDLLPASLFADGPTDAAGLFDGADLAAHTSEWLDATFNGDFLPVSAGLYRQLPADAFKTLGNIMRRADRGQLHLGWEEKWENLDFSHIPVGVLSQAYEHYLHEHAPDKQQKEGGYYTPRIIADMMVRGAFHALRRDGVAHRARILDAAAGAGVFLITAFRQLVSERWMHDGVQPDTGALRKILYSQVTGFDINESALRFAALGLYLASIELDPHPEPVQKLRFENLRGTVLHYVGADSGDAQSSGLGSLGSLVSEMHSGRYDLVFGNPPWASSTGLPEWPNVEERVARIARARIPGSPAPRLPNEVLDLPFVWRAMEWAKPGGQIALALHARLLFQQGEGMPEARSAVCRTLNVTGVINGSEIRHTNVWPEISAPFCLLFARNEVPSPGAGFRFVSPHVEDSLNGAGGLRVDASNAEMVTAEQVIRQPEILKILFRGGPLDLEVYDRLKSRHLQTLDSFWRTCFGESRGRPRFAGNGYQKLRESSRIRKTGDGQPGVSAAYLHGLPECTPDAFQLTLLDTSSMPKFSLPRIHDPRPIELFRGPILIVHEAPPAQRGRIRVAVSDGDVLFNQSYHGYSAGTHIRGRLLVRYLALILGSKPALWFALMVSGRFGFEREVVEKITIDKIPLPPFDELDESQLQEIDGLFEDLVSRNDDIAWLRVDTWVSALYGLGKQDLQVITDTLSFNLPFADIRRAAQTPPTETATAAFCHALTAELMPWAKGTGKTIGAHVSPLPASSPWQVVRVGTGSASRRIAAKRDWPEILHLADQLAATEVIYPDAGAGCIWLARLNQARYWSHSQARLAARRIAWEHMDCLLERTAQ